MNISRTPAEITIDDLRLRVKELEDVMAEDGCQAAKAHMETARAHLDNAKLQDEAIHNEGVMVALKEGYERRGEEIERLKARLEEAGDGMDND